MKKQLVLFGLLIFLGSSNLFSQVVIYSEDFDAGLTWTLNTDLTGEGANPHNWYISCEEEGVGAGICAEDCGAGNQTLHIGLNPLAGDMGATYGELGTGLTTTNRRAESADISTVGDVDLTLTFDMIGAGGGTDFAEVFYSIDGGTSWISLDAPLTSNCCGDVPCTGADGEEGLWENKSYPLPATCEGIPNLRISFVWQNVDDGVFTNPSIAVDNIQISKPVVDVPGGPTALFDPEDITICKGETITYTDLSTTDDVITDWNWVFDGGSPTGALTAGPHAVTYFTAGVYTTTLTVTDGIGSNDTTFTVTVEEGPYSGEDVAIDLCEGDVIDLNTILTTGADAGGTWTETGTPSGGFTAATGTLDGTGLTVGDAFTFEYETGPGAAPCIGPDVATMTVTIVACEDLHASFSASDLEICVDDCITFTDLSTGTGITGYVWSFTDAAIGGPLTGADPGPVCFPTAGDIDVTLTITDGTDTDDTTITITVNPLPLVTATASSTTVCEGEEVTLTATGDALTYTWSDGVTDDTPFTIDATTSYTLTGVNNFGCENTDDITITVLECDPLVAGFEYDNIICVGDCRTYTDTSSGDPVSWFWDWGGGGGVAPWFSTAQNPTVCFILPGTYDIQLTVTNALGETSSTTNSITVFESPTISAELDTVIDIGGTANLVATGSSPGDYSWSPEDYVECPDCQITTASPPSTMDYIVTLTDVNECTATDTVSVYVNFEWALGVPEAFSPNGDGLNDILYVDGIGLETVSFSVYNKYGEKVFESQTQDIGWDGKFRGRDQNPGVFTWILEYQFIDGNSGKRKGNTTLIR